MRHCARQAAYEARVRAWLFYPATLSALEIDCLVALGWLREGSEGDCSHVGEAVASAIRDMALRRCGQLTRPEGRFD